MLVEPTDNPPCVECGLCREACPVFAILRQESLGPRGRAILAGRGIASLTFFQCTACRACQVVCPVAHSPDTEALRANLVRQGVETESNREMIANIRSYGNPFGPLKEGEIPKTLVCC